ncbi:MAG: methyltransferase domain-containing protein [Nitrospira sp.]|nr:methyltransferase domain-containing protein [Nitrospira sp.]
MSNPNNDGGGTAHTMISVFDKVYRTVASPLSERWLGGFHAGLVIKGLYLQWKVAAFLRQGGRRVMDAGCGPEAQLTAMLAGRYPTCSFVGWDLHVDREVRDALPRTNVSVIESDLARLASIGEYDLVYSIDVLEHIDDFEGTLDRLVSALRSGGLLFIHVPSLEQRFWFGSGEEEAPDRFRAHRSGDDHVHEGFSLSQLTEALERRSVTVLDARPTFGRWVGLLKETFSYGEGRRVSGIGLLLLPAVLLTVALEMLFVPKRGNGSMIVGMKRERASA